LSTIEVMPGKSQVLQAASTTMVPQTDEQTSKPVVVELRDDLTVPPIDVLPSFIVPVSRDVMGPLGVKSSSAGGENAKEWVKRSLELDESLGHARVVEDDVCAGLDKLDGERYTPPMPAYEPHDTTRLPYALDGHTNSVGQEMLRDYSLVPSFDSPLLYGEEDYSTRLPYSDEEEHVNSVAQEAFRGFSLLPSFDGDDLAGRRIDCY